MKEKQLHFKAVRGGGAGVVCGDPGGGAGGAGAAAHGGPTVGSGAGGARNSLKIPGKESP